MRTFDHVDEKLLESDFFIEQMEKLDFNWFAMRCYFSAFVSSSRSVTFALQASMNGIAGFSAWYAEIQTELRANQLARFFHNCRTDNQKIGFNHLIGGTARDGKMIYWFGEPTSGSYDFIPEDDVLTTCKCYMFTLCDIIDRAYQEFGIEIDPDQRFTPEGLEKLGLTLEDIEESIGFPRGYTNVEWEGGDSDLIRLELLRKQISGSIVKPLLSKYLGRELAYPTGPYRAPKIE